MKVDDRRKYIRYDMPLDVKFRKMDDSSEYTSGVLKNVSRSGLCFASKDKSLQLREVLDLQVKIPNEDTFVSAIGDIMWKQDLENEVLFGLSLMAMDAEAKSVILDGAYDKWLNEMRS